MRVVICTRARLLGAALAEGLRECGDQVVAMTSTPRSAYGAIVHSRPDVLVADGWAGIDLTIDVPDVPIVLLCDDARPAQPSLLRRAPTIVPRAATMSEIIATIHGMAGAALPAPRRRPRRPRIGTVSGSGQLAQFLSDREREVLSELVLGSDTATLATRLRISRSTARDHVQSVLTKLNAHSRLELVSMAVRDGLVDPMTGAWLGAAG